MSWNLWWRFGPWSQRQPVIADVLAGSGADLIGLQEVFVEEGGVNQAEVLARRLGYHAMVGDLSFHQGLAFTNAILSRWPIVARECHPLPGPDGRNGHRRVLYARVSSPFGPLAFFTTHLDWSFDASATRQAQVAVVAQLVATRRPGPEDGFPAVLTGDFNALPHSDEMRSLTGASAPPVPGLVFTDAWEVGGDGTPGWTWDGRNPHLAEATWPNRRLDYVLVSWPRPKPRGTVARSWLVGADAVAGVTPSDHYAVVADLRTG